MKNIFIKGLASLAILAGVAACSEADVASSNLSRAAEQFEINRRIVFYNGITGEYILTVEGRCSVAAPTTTLAITCKTNEETFIKHYLGLSDNVTFFSEQLQGVDVSTYHYRVIFRPDVIIPNVDVQTQLGGG